MEMVATVASAAIVLIIAWQLLGSIWNIVSIVYGLFKD